MNKKKPQKSSRVSEKPELPCLYWNTDLKEFAIVQQHDSSGLRCARWGRGISGSQPYHVALHSHQPQEERQAPCVNGRSPRKTQVLQGIQKGRAGNTKASLLLPNVQGASVMQRCCSGWDRAASAEMPELAHSKAAVCLQQPRRGWAGPVDPAENPTGEKGLHTPGWAAVVLPAMETESQLNSTLGCDKQESANGPYGVLHFMVVLGTKCHPVLQLDQVRIRSKSFTDSLMFGFAKIELSEEPQRHVCYATTRRDFRALLAPYAFLLGDPEVPWEGMQKKT